MRPPASGSTSPWSMPEDLALAQDGVEVHRHRARARAAGPRPGAEPDAEPEGLEQRRLLHKLRALEVASASQARSMIEYSSGASRAALTIGGTEGHGAPGGVVGYRWEGSTIGCPAVKAIARS